MPTRADREVLARLADPLWLHGTDEGADVEPTLMALAAHYFLRVKSKEGRPVDPVARFHLGNGARLERINWLGDTSDKGQSEAYGLMVNYRYDLKEIEHNHEAFADTGEIAAAKAVKALLRPVETPKKGGARRLALPGR